ncbi:hypothetical protein N9B14_01430 [Akkermansiaceae bacterium]|nr:hypothetical protein [Akkermansiaceae bacterium]
MALPAFKRRDAVVMEPISTALAGISLVKASVDFIKQNISTAKDIGEIAGQIDALFTGQKQVQDASNRKSGVGLADQFGVQSVAQEMIDAKLAAEKMQEVAQMVNMRFGPDTWSSILAERNRRIQEAKEAQAKARAAARKAHDEFVQNMKMGAAIVGVIGAAILLFIFLMVSVAKALVA